jgi:hypothetical protein
MTTTLTLGFKFQFTVSTIKGTHVCTVHRGRQHLKNYRLVQRNEAASGKNRSLQCTDELVIRTVNGDWN